MNLGASSGSVGHFTSYGRPTVETAELHRWWGLGKPSERLLSQTTRALDPPNSDDEHGEKDEKFQHKLRFVRSSNYYGKESRTP